MTRAQQSTTHLIKANMLLFKARFLTYVCSQPVGCWCSRCQDPLKAASFTFLDVATLKYHFRCHFYRLKWHRDQYSQAAASSDLLIPDPFYSPPTLSFSLTGGHTSSGFICLCSLSSPSFKRRCPLHTMIWLPLGDNSRSAPPLRHGCLITPVISADPVS